MITLTDTQVQALQSAHRIEVRVPMPLFSLSYMGVVYWITPDCDKNTVWMGGCMNKQEMAKRVRAILKAAGEQTARYTNSGYAIRNNRDGSGHIAGFRVVQNKDGVMVYFEPLPTMRSQKPHYSTTLHRYLGILNAAGIVVEQQGDFLIVRNGESV